MKNLFDFENEPFCILEGGTGLNDTERELEKKFQLKDRRVYVIENLYEDPKQLLALAYLKPKTVIFGTTGVYQDDLRHCIDIFKIGEYFPQTVIISMGMNLGIIRDLLKEAKNLNANFQAFEIAPLDIYDEGAEVELTEIDL